MAKFLHYFRWVLSLHPLNLSLWSSTWKIRSFWLHKEQQIFSHVERKYIPLVKSRATSFNPGVVERAPMAAILLVLLFVWPVLAAAPSLHVTAAAWRSVKPAWRRLLNHTICRILIFPPWRSWRCSHISEAVVAQHQHWRPDVFCTRGVTSLACQEKKVRFQRLKVNRKARWAHIQREEDPSILQDIHGHSTLFYIPFSSSIRRKMCFFFCFFLRVTWQLFCRKDRFAMMPLYSPAVLALRKIQDQFPTGVVHLGRLVVK